MKCKYVKEFKELDEAPCEWCKYSYFNIHRDFEYTCHYNSQKHSLAYLKAKDSLMRLRERN